MTSYTKTQMGANFFLFIFVRSLNIDEKHLAEGDEVDCESSQALSSRYYNKPLLSDEGEEGGARVISMSDYDTDNESMDRVRQLSVA